MKNLLFLAFGVFSPIGIFAAGPIDYFEVIPDKESAGVGEALDLTINAVDKNGEIVTDYTGDILVFSESDPKAEFPNDLAENSYSFTAVNEGTVKFENAVVFSNKGVQDIYVYDLDDDSILGLAEINISEEEKDTNVDIEIISPEDGITTGDNSVDISGTTRKNYQVRVMVNGEQELSTISDNDGVFSVEAEDLPEGSSNIVAEILDADENVIGTSPEVSIKVNAQKPEFKRISITPEGEVEAETSINIEVVSNSGLREVQVILNDIITTLEETKSGIYQSSLVAPSEAGEYPIDVILKNEFANETTQRAVETLTVIPKPELNAGGEEEPVEEIEIIEDIPTNKEKPERDLAIKNIEVTELKTKSVLTWDMVEDAESYNIYKKVDTNKVQLIENITEPRFEIEIVGEEITYDDFAIKALAKTASGETIQGDLSEMTRVKTGPELYFIFAILALLMSSGIFFFRKKT